MPQLKPCGTMAAYRRHRRNNETPCDDCKRAEREAKAAQRAEERAETAREMVTAIQADPDPGKVDPLEDARRNLRIVQAAMDAAPAAAIAPLSKRRQELVFLIHEMSNATTERTLADELASARARRTASA